MNTENKTIAQWLGITSFPFQIKVNGKVIYYEDSGGYWSKSEYNKDGNQIYFEDSNGFWYKREYDKDGKVIYYENSYSWWDKSEYDENGNLIYWETSKDGIITDKRPKKEFTMDAVAKALGISVEKLKIKK